MRATIHTHKARIRRHRRGRAHAVRAKSLKSVSKVYAALNKKWMEKFKDRVQDRSRGFYGFEFKRWFRSEDGGEVGLVTIERKPRPEGKFSKADKSTKGTVKSLSLIHI